MTLQHIAASQGFALAEVATEKATALEARHPSGAVVRTWLMDPSPDRPARMVQMDAPRGQNVPHAMRLALGQLGGSDPARVTVTVGGVASQERTWQRALALAASGAWGCYAPPSKAARAQMEDAGARRFGLQLRQALRELTDAAALDCVTPDLLARCTETLDLASRDVQSERSAPKRSAPPKYERLAAAIERARIDTDTPDGAPVPRYEARKAWTAISGIKDRGNCSRAFEACLAYALETGAATMTGGLISSSPTA